jgi:tellurite resistance protein TerC
VTRHNGRRSVTPIGLALLALVAADITFAVDSNPAAFGITTDAFTIWLANALALLGLVPLLALVRALVKRFRYMRQTVSAVLVFIGVRLLIEQRPTALLPARPRPLDNGPRACALAP